MKDLSDLKQRYILYEFPFIRVYKWNEERVLNILDSITPLEGESYYTYYIDGEHTESYLGIIFPKIKDMPDTITCRIHWISHKYSLVKFVKIKNLKEYTSTRPETVCVWKFKKPNSKAIGTSIIDGLSCKVRQINTNEDCLGYEEAELFEWRAGVKF